MALTGFLQSSVCYSDINAAYADYVYSLPFPAVPSSQFVSLMFSSRFGAFYGLNGQYYFSFFDYSSGKLIWLSNLLLPPPVFQSCDPLQPFLDGSFLGFTVAGAVISVSLLAVLRRAL